MPRDFEELTKTVFVELPGGGTDVRICLTWEHAEQLYEAARRNDEKALANWGRVFAREVRKVL